MEIEKGNNVRGARTLRYLRGELEFVRKKKEYTHSMVFIGRRMAILRQIAELLHEDSRMTLTEISRRTGIPVSTVFDNLKRIREQFRFTIVPEEFYSGEDLVEAGQTCMGDFKPFLKAS